MKSITRSRIKAVLLASLGDKMKYIKDIRTYKKLYKKSERKQFPIRVKYLFPVLMEHRTISGNTNGPFLQDLVVAKKIFESGVKEHVDLGSRIDGFISIISVFLDRVTVFDIRPNLDKIFNIEFKQEDGTKLFSVPDNSVASISSIYAIANFGLGRYGDPVDPDADIKAMSALQRILKPEGTLYFSIDIGKERLEYNGHRIYFPKTVLEYFKGLTLKEFIAIDPDGRLCDNLTPEDTDIYNSWTGHWGLGIFIFSKDLHE